MMSASVRFLQCGQDCHCAMRAQFVRFSEAVMVNTPARSGTWRKTYARASLIQRRTAGCDVHRAVSSPSRTPAISGRSLKKAVGIARGSFMYRYTPMPYFFARAVNVAKIGDAPLAADAELGEGGPARRQIAQHHVQPDAVDSQGRQPLQQPVGIGIQLGAQQRVAVDRRIGIDESQRHPWVVAGRRQGGRGGSRRPAR